MPPSFADEPREGFYKLAPGDPRFDLATHLCYVHMGRPHSAQFPDGHIIQIGEGEGQIHPRTLENVTHKELRDYIGLANFILNVK